MLYPLETIAELRDTALVYMHIDSLCCCREHLVQVLFNLHLQVIVWAGSFSFLAFFILKRTGLLRIDEAVAAVGKGEACLFNGFFSCLPRSKRWLQHMKKCHRNPTKAKCI